MDAIEVVTMRPAATKSVVFDWDGTIFTGLDIWMDMQSDIIDGILACGPSDDPSGRARSLVHSTKGLTDEERFQKAIDMLPQRSRDAHDASEYALDYQRRIEEYVSSMIPKWAEEPQKYIVEGLVGFIEVLKEKDVPLYVATANHVLVKYDLVKVLGLARFFRGIYGVGSPGFDPFSKTEAIRRVIETVGGGVAVIGDGEGDMRAAKTAGAYAVGISHEASMRRGLVDAGADMILNRLYSDPEEIALTLNIR
jgi:phosphoglycolate phosphatase-like HAD superfamily hydrolase